jgi:hypothetical protein
MRNTRQLDSTLCYMSTISRVYLNARYNHAGEEFSASEPHWIQSVARAIRNSGYNPTY